MFPLTTSSAIAAVACKSLNLTFIVSNPSCKAAQKNAQPSPTDTLP
jgi:hypothetical protein